MKSALNITFYFISLSAPITHTDTEEFPFDSPDLDWFHNPRITNRHFRPPIEHCVGHFVEVEGDEVSPRSGAPKGEKMIGEWCLLFLH